MTISSDPKREEAIRLASRYQPQGDYVCSVEGILALAFLDEVKAHTVCKSRFCEVSDNLTAARKKIAELEAEKARAYDKQNLILERDALNAKVTQLEACIKRWEDKEEHEAMDCYVSNERLELLEAVAEAAKGCGYDHKSASVYGFDQLRNALAALKPPLRP